MDEVRFSVRITAKDMFYFFIQHSYRGPALILNAAITIGALALFFVGLGKDDLLKSVMLLIMAALFSVVYPLQLYFRARKQVRKNPVFAEPMWYALVEEGIVMWQGEQKESFAWENIYSVRETRSLMAVYTGRIYACIWPKSEIKEQEEAIRQRMSEHLSSKVYKRKEMGE